MSIPGTVSNLIKKFRSLNIEQVAQDSMESALPQLVDRQKDQMLSGLNKKGKIIGKYKSAAYANLKHSMNPIPGLGVPDLLLSGDFYRKIYGDVRGNTLILDSTDEKAGFLAKRFGEEIFGLNKDSKKEFIKEDLKPAFMTEIKKVVRL